MKKSFLRLALTLFLCLGATAVISADSRSPAESGSQRESSAPLNVDKLGRGSCGGWVKDSSGHVTCCSSGQRPICDDTGSCACTSDPECLGNKTTDCPK